MSQHDDATRLRHMLSNAREALEMARGRNRQDLDRDRMLELSLVRLLEIVGEAASRVTAETQQRFDRIPWAEIIGMRNRLIHGYDRVDLDILWTIVQDDLSHLVEELDAALQKAKPPDHR